MEITLFILETLRITIVTDMESYSREKKVNTKDIGLMIVK